MKHISSFPPPADACRCSPPQRPVERPGSLQQLSRGLPVSGNVDQGLPVSGNVDQGLPVSGNVDQGLPVSGNVLLTYRFTSDKTLQASIARTHPGFLPDRNTSPPSLFSLT
ncbi:hypothetical protein CgunFtcFv8_025220 [Champsocephalus gunnari]|uniref:Uncharacterized protein n=1 Tax=Champsocephalus gunnari TaxID=52237 RepID=A0AAN8H345_CHAGU|nr:hypothetical protein CgunFtcFv8_025220 [Champsocephalus gunnari]